MLDKDKLMCYIKQEFPKTIDNHWNWDLLGNIIEYGIKYESCSQKQLLKFLMNIIPEITEEEILKFMK